MPSRKPASWAADPGLTRTERHALAPGGTRHLDADVAGVPFARIRTDEL
jgi:hypothetical protein